MKLNAVEEALMNNPVRAGIQRRYEARVLERLGGHVDGGRALEIGCGRGVGVEIIIDRFRAATVVAFDMDPDMVQRARARLARYSDRVRLSVGDAGAIDQPGATFDAVFDFGAIHHVPDWRAAVGEVARVLKPGGRFYFEEVTRHALQRWSYRAFLDHPQDDRFSAEDLISNKDSRPVTPGRPASSATSSSVSPRRTSHDRRGTGRWHWSVRRSTMPAVKSAAEVQLLMSGLVKTFGPTRALDGLDMSVATGEVHGLLGPNGSGKTTAIRVLLGLLRADAGEVTLLGGDPWRDAVRLHRRLAYVPGDVNRWPTLTGGEIIDLLGRLRGGLDRTRRAELLEQFALDPTRKARTYSKGNRQKVSLVAALASDAELLILDEPTSGLDPLMEAVFQDRIREARAHGRTVLLSSHILAEVEALCDRVSIIRAGRTVETGTLAQLRHLTRTSIAADTARPATGLAELPGVHDLHADDLRVRFHVDTNHLDDAMRHLARLGIRSLTSHPPTLEELFLRHYRDEPAEEREPPDGHRHATAPGPAKGAGGRP